MAIQKMSTVDPLAAAVPSTCAVNYKQTNRDASL